MTQAQYKQAEEFDKLQERLHTDWLKHPNTKALLSIIGMWQTNHVKELQNGILISSNKEKEDKARVAINTIDVLYRLITETDLFVANQKQLTPNT